MGTHKSLGGQVAVWFVGNLHVDSTVDLAV
jgi:hypothetical protein